MLRRLTVILVVGVLAIGGLLAYVSDGDITGLMPSPGASAPMVPPAEAAPVAPGLPAAPVSGSETATVVRVVDGDTLIIDRGNGTERLRLIGVDTPETVQPNSPVECFGPEASAYLTDLLSGETVSLDLDPGQGDTDRYDRLLRYVWVASGDGTWSSVEALLLSGGYAEPYRDAHERKAGFDALAAEAQANGRGLWGACS